MTREFETWRLPPSRHRQRAEVLHEEAGPTRSGGLAGVAQMNHSSGLLIGMVVTLLMSACEQKRAGDTRAMVSESKATDSSLPPYCQPNSFNFLIALQGVPDPPTVACSPSGARVKGLTADEWCADVSQFTPRDWTGFGPSQSPDTTWFDNPDWLEELRKIEADIAWLDREYEPDDVTAESVWLGAVLENAAKMTSWLVVKGRGKLVRVFLSLELLVEAVKTVNAEDIFEDSRQDFRQKQRLLLVGLGTVTSSLATAIEVGYGSH